jgi:hypothetical protein
MDFSALAAAASLAEIFDRSKLGIAMAAMIRMIATTINSSTIVKPRCLLSAPNRSKVPVSRHTNFPLRLHHAKRGPISCFRAERYLLRGYSIEF